MKTDGGHVTITVGAKRTLEYVFECLAHFNRGSNQVLLRSLGLCTSKAIEVSQILRELFRVTLGPAEIRQLGKNGVKFTCLEIPLVRGGEIMGDTQFSPDPESDFLEFPIYHLLFDFLLNQQRELSLDAELSPLEEAARSGAGPKHRGHLLKIVPTKGGFKCTPGRDLAEAIGKKESEDDRKRRRQLLGHMASAFCRCGLALSEGWEVVSEKLAKHDDVILGLDTNVLYDSVLTQQLLDGFVLVGGGNYKHTPNWLLLIIPNAVMHEIEQAANSREGHGGLTFIGRMGYRALQEILEMERSKDLVGASLLIVGEANPVLDTRVELRGLREDFKAAAPQEIRPTLFRKLSAGDTLIRDQFKGFLRQISFHKGTYFLTGDKSNCALAEAEGLESIYYPPVAWDALLQSGHKAEAPSVGYEGERITLNVPFGKLVYEVAVEFGRIWLRWKEGDVQVKCDARGDSLERWIKRDLQIDRKELRRLVHQYGNGRTFGLGDVCRVWKGATRELMGIL
jgi:DNA-binding protein